MKSTISYKRFINRIVVTTIIIIGILFFLYGYFIQSTSIKQNLKNETSLFIDLIFENLYTAMQRGASKEDIQGIITNIEKKISNSSIQLYENIDEVEDPYIKNIFSTKKADFFQNRSSIDFARPILYQQNCLSCHVNGEVGEIAAVIRLKFSILDLNVSLKDILVMISMLFFISILVIFAVWYSYLYRAFIEPFKSLIGQMKNISEHKDLKKELKIESNIKEIKDLESVFNTQNKKLSLAYDKLEHTSNIDSLTQIYNRKKFNEYIIEELELVERYDYDMTLILIDLNKFKFINDTYGHDVGDLILIEFTKVISKNIRTTDKLFRLGGDEFILVLSHTSYDEALGVVQTLKNILANYKVNHNEIKLTIGASFGLASYKKDATTLQELLVIADKRMYEEKNATKKEQDSLKNS